MIKFFIQLLIMPLPQAFRKYVLAKVFGFNFDKTTRLGFSIFLIDSLDMGKNSYIGHLNFFKGLEKVKLKENSSIGNLNWITAFSKNINSKHFSHQNERQTKLTLGAHSAITNRHLIDCTSSVTIGDFTTVAGFRSQVMTHSIDLKMCRQSSSSILIGDYVFVGTNNIILPGSVIPNRSIIAASSTVIGELIDENSLYGGAPAKKIKSIDPQHYLYLSRKVGFVV